MNYDQNAELARLHRADLRAAAEHARLARSAARPSGAPARPPALLRLYARLWWATRPRAAAGTPALFGG